MSMQTKKNISIALLAAAMLLWILRKMNVLYIPGLSMFLLAVSMLIVAVMMFQLKQKKKAGGTLLFAFGLFCIVAGIMEIKGYMACPADKKRSTRGCFFFVVSQQYPQTPLRRYAGRRSERPCVSPWRYAPAVR